MVARAVRAFEEAGAIVEEVTLGIKRSQQELSDLWCRMIMPGSLLFFETMKEQGIDLLGDHAADLPPEVHAWTEIAQGMSALDTMRDQAMRSEVYDAIQAALADHDLLVTPTLACLPVDNGTDGNTVDPLIGWCLTYPINFTGHPAASVPAGLADGLPVGMQIVGRRFADADVLAASAAFERLRPWQASYRIPAERSVTPPCAST